MDEEVEKALPESEERTSKIFLDFMTRMTKFEELTDVGNKLLVRFRQEIEMFRRPQIQNISNIVSKIIEANCTDRMKAYVDSGCRNSNQNVQNISNLHSCQKGLEDHLEKAGVLLHDLECLAGDAIVITQTAIQNGSSLPNESSSDDVEAEAEAEPLPFQDRLISQVTLMRVIYAMLKLDYTMQEKIVKSLNPVTPSSELESYCLLWDLHPYINENVIKLAWKHVQV